MEYVVIYAKPVNRDITDSVLLVLKNKPDWQKGKLNLPGGKIEAGETPIEAAVRELKEEAGLDPVCPAREVGKITGSWGTVHCVIVPIFDRTLNPGPNETEVIAWVGYREAIMHEALVPNLRLVIPMMAMSVQDWTIHDEGPTWDGPTHRVLIDVPMDTTLPRPE